jgi:hypothetical protein
MAKKMFWNRQRDIPTTETHSVSREDIAPYSSRNIPASETAEQPPFRILDETSNLFQNLKRPAVVCLSSLILRVKSKISPLISRNALPHLLST